MQRDMESEVQHTHGEQIDEIALALLKGDFRVIEIERSGYGGYVESNITLNVNGAEITMTNTSLRGC